MLAVLHAEAGASDASLRLAKQALQAAAKQPSLLLTPVCLALVALLLSARCVCVRNCARAGRG